MDEPSMDHYEKQLYSVFKSFDVNNEESLDESAVNNLCDALQLEERGAALVDTLFERRSDRVTFTQFRSGLLAVLGDPPPPDPAPDAPPDPLADPSPDPSADPPPDPPHDPPHSDDDSGSEHELVPRFVFGAKKYGRRSRAQHGGAGAARAASASRLEAAGGRPRARYRRSASAVEPRDEPALQHARRVGPAEALALCAELRMPAVDRRLVERAFDHCADATLGEFFERLDRELAGAVRAAAAPPDEDDPDAGVAADRLADAWRAAGVRRPRRLLADLGVGAAARAPELERALDDELRAFDEPLDARATLLAAALALARLRAAAAARARDSAAAERDAQRAARAAAEERARVLALDVDESHARIDAELRASLKRAEAQRAEEARRALAAAAAERERAAGEAARLRAELARAAEGEARARRDAAALRERADELEARALAAEERGAAAERTGARLAARLRDEEARGAAAAAAAEAARGAEARALELAADNQRLRDRADELAAALERAPPAAPRGAEASGGDLSAELRSLLGPEPAEDAGGGDAAAEEPSGGDAAEAQRLAALVKELEGALEAMRGEYESCEEYWARKLADERAAHDADASAADERLADLLARIDAFERRLAPPAPLAHRALPPIPEAAALEAQVHDLEEEFARYRRAARARLAHMAARLAAAPAPPPAPSAPPAGLAARCARAEGAVRRLQARLAAADVLVKELYVENCQLAHARPLPL